MKKEYNQQPDENSDMLNEPAIEYGIQKEIKILSLTEEELKDALTTEQVKEHLHAHIHKLFNQ